MSDQRSDELELRIDLLAESLQTLTVEVSGLAERVGSLESSSYTLVTESPEVRPAASSLAGQGSPNGGYSVCAAEIPAVPDFLVRSCAVLRGGRLSFEERAKRAWEAGWWARFTLQGRVPKPRPSRPIDLANSIYVILRAEGHQCLLLATKASDYRYLVKDFTEESISHGFASQAEAKAYCLGAGVEYPQSVLRWTGQR